MTEKCVVCLPLLSEFINKGIAAAGMERIGGDTADDAIVRYVKDSYNITIGKNSMVSGITEVSDYENGRLDSGKTFVKAGD